MVKLSLWTLALIFGLMSCRVSPTESPQNVPPSVLPSSSPTIVLASSTVAPAGKTQPPANDAVITFERSGGFVGVSEKWSVYADGRVIGADGKQGRVPADQVTGLLRTIDAAGFFNWRDLPFPRNTCCDRFTYVLMVRMAGRENTVTTIDGASDQPAGLRPLLDQVMRFINDATSK